MRKDTRSNTEKRIDAALAQLEQTAQTHRDQWQRANVIWAGHRFTAGRAAQ